VLATAVSLAEDPKHICHCLILSGSFFCWYVQCMHVSLALERPHTTKSRRLQKLFQKRNFLLF